MVSARLNPAAAVLMEEMTSKEVGDALRNGKDTVLVSVGSFEQHGPHLPLGTDTYIGDAYAVQIARELGNALVAPSIRPGLSHPHIGFPGTITLRPETMIRIMWDYAESLQRHGFKNIVFISSHRGNNNTMRVARSKLSFEWGKAKILVIERLPKYAQGNTPSDSESGHAGKRETSVMQFIKPDFVKIDRAVRSIPPPMDYEDIVTGPLERISPSGVLGDATKANADLGKKDFETICKGAASEIRNRIATLKMAYDR